MAGEAIDQHAAMPWPSRFRRRWRSAAQLAGTLLILGLVPGNAAKLAFLAILWAATFGRVSRREALCFVVVCVLFTAMDVEMIRRGAFAFGRPDVLGLPLYEFFMWGFYVLHASRTLGGYAERDSLRLAAALGVAYSIPFAVLGDPAMLFAVATAMLAVTLAIFHRKIDFAYAGYMAIVGMLIEYTGVLGGQWSYPHAPAGGVPWWSLPMWAGVGIFARRIVTPLLREPLTSAS